MQYIYMCKCFKIDYNNHSKIWRRIKPIYMNNIYVYIVRDDSLQTYSSSQLRIRKVFKVCKYPVFILLNAKICELCVFVYNNLCVKVIINSKK